VVFVGRLARDAQADEPDDVGRRVSEGVIAVGDDADGAGGVAKHQLGKRHHDVQQEDLEENTTDRLMP
jgi:hypothetical protein